MRHRAVKSAGAVPNRLNQNYLLSFGSRFRLLNHPFHQPRLPKTTRLPKTKARAQLDSDKRFPMRRSLRRVLEGIVCVRIASSFYSLVFRRSRMANSEHRDKEPSTSSIERAEREVQRAVGIAEAN